MKDTENKDKQIKSHLFLVIKQLGNVTWALIRQFPGLIFFSLIMFLIAFDRLKENSQTIIIVLCIVVTLLSIIIYMRSNRFDETALTFILGLFTVFSISWNKEKAIVFAVFFTLFAWFIFLISSIKLASKLESILIDASVNYNLNNNDHCFKSLKAICNKTSKNGYLNTLEKSEVVRFFAFKKIPFEHIEPLLDMCESCIMISHYKPEKVASFIYSLYVTLGYLDNEIDSYELEKTIDQIVILPCSLADFIEIFEVTRKYILQNRIDFSEYIRNIKDSIKNGLSPTDIETLLSEIC